MPVGMCVGGAAIDIAYARIVGEAVAVDAEEPLASLALRLQACRLDVASLVIDRSVGEAQAADVAVAVEPRHPLILRWTVLEVTLHAHERAFDVLGDLAPDLAVVHVRLEARRAVETRR